MKKTASPKTATPILNVNENLSLEEQVTQRAHQLWEQRGYEHGHDLSDWSQAERDICEWHQRRLQVKGTRDRDLASR